MRSLCLLRDEGLLDLRRGRGVTVSGTSKQGAVVARANELIRFAHHHGYPRGELIRLMQTLPSDWHLHVVVGAERPAGAGDVIEVETAVKRWSSVDSGSARRDGGAMRARDYGDSGRTAPGRIATAKQMAGVVTLDSRLMLNLRTRGFGRWPDRW